MTRIRFFLPLLALTLLVAACGDSSPDPPSRIDGYVALAPKVFRAGETETVSLTLFHGARLASSDVEVSLARDGEPIVNGAAEIDGKGAVEIPVPADASGEYQLTVVGNGFKDKATVSVQAGTLLFLETDKPIYKPGQTIRMRVVSLNSELKPMPGSAVVEIADAKGNKIFKQTVETDEFGMGTLDLPLSPEPNLGVWSITTTAGDASTQIDVRVEEYVLPKYEISVETEKPWFLAGEEILGTVSAEYSFGKPVSGELQVKALRYVGVWEEFGNVTTEVVDGRAEFQLPAAGYVAGVPEAGGQGNVQLDFTVVERSTGYQETTSELLTVAAAPVVLQLIPETPSFKPGLPFNLLLISETPDGQPVESEVNVDIYYTDERYAQAGSQPDTQRVATERGLGTVTVVPPDGAASMYVSASVGDAGTYKQVAAAYSPSGNFIHVSQISPTDLAPGDTARFHVDSTSEARTFYYEVVSRDRVVFTAVSESADFSFKVTPAMAGTNRLLVYQVLPNSEVAADFIPFDVATSYPHNVTATFNTDESAPGDSLEVQVQAEGRSKVGLVAVDRSVYILAENRLNLQQVFDEIERLYQQPQAELHEVEFLPGPVVIPGAVETFEGAGLLVMTDKRVPGGKELGGFGILMAGAGGDDVQEALVPVPVAGLPRVGDDDQLGLAEVQRVRQFFPETWIWEEVTTGDDGAATLPVEAPDTITTWDLRAVAISPDKGLGVAEAELRVFQPFFLSADLPYSAIRGEEFPLKVALYNYTDSEQQFQVDIEIQPWFDLLDDAAKTVTVAPNDIGGAEFRIRPKGVGTQTVKVTARSTETADAVIKSMIVEPEGVQRETVENGILNAGATRAIDLPVPPGIVPDSARSYVAITGSLLGQTIQGLDQLLAMPYGCGEQNMLLFAPDAYILTYLKGTSQLKPEVRAKAETLLVTGYQRELTYKRADGSFSAFGDSDPEGSLFLTAFVLKTFAQASQVIYIDDAVMAAAADWLVAHQNADGSFQDVGFVHHQELLGGVQGQDALTAYAAIAMIEAGQADSAEKAIGFLETRLDAVEEPYALALVTYALELADSGRAGEAYGRLLEKANASDEGLHWSGKIDVLPLEEDARFSPYPGQVSGSSDIEATAYATLALIEHGDPVNAGLAAKWLTAHRNSFGGFGSTQDTVVALQALTQFAASAGSDTEMTVTVRAAGEVHTVEITHENFDVLQLVEVPAGAPVTIEGEGTGQAVFQAVTRYNLPQAERPGESIFDIAVDYDTASVDVNDIVGLDVSLTFSPPEPVKAGMIVLDVSVPTGFAPVVESLHALAGPNPRIKRYDVAGRKVILYIEDMSPGESLQFSFDVMALYPVKAKGTASQAYSYYKPEWRGEAISEAVTVR